MVPDAPPAAPAAAEPTEKPSAPSPDALVDVPASPVEPASSASATPTGEATGEVKTGSFKMTAEHCKELGKKFTQLTLDAGGSRAEAQNIGNDFAGKCKRDQVGQTTTHSEYDCILAVKTVTDIPACK